MMGLERMGYAEKRGYLRLNYNVVVLGGSERVVRAADPECQDKTPPSSFCRKDKRLPGHSTFYSKRIELALLVWYNKPRIPNQDVRLPDLFYGEKEGEGGVGLHAQLQVPPVPSPRARCPKKYFQERP